MNERIRELAEQAGVINNNFNPLAYEQWYLDALEKFAELIVDQMLEITDAHTEVFQTDRDRAVIEHIKQSVKQHFGVEQ
jgi:23S rRNA G2069 N7-methylase RlmK/C1962 C5-methylase RlmI